jgi:CubicO group peptidase (beta-lactamase class C family)
LTSNLQGRECIDQIKESIMRIPVRTLSTAVLAAGIAASGCSGGGGSSSSSNPGNPGPSAKSWNQVSAYLDQTVTDKQLTGYAFGVFDAHDVLFKQAGGDETLDSVEPIASASKLPAAAAIMTLVDQGKLDLDTPVSNYLQGHINWPAGKAAITMRMLLSHTSGLPDDTNASAPPCMQNRTTTMDACAQEIADAALSYPPGTNFDYGGVDYQLAGYIATLVSGESTWQSFFDKAIVQPLQLSSFTFDPNNIATNPSIGGGAASDLTDYSSFLQMILDGGSYNGKQILSASAVAEIEKNEIGSSINIANSPLPTEQYPGYGFGVFIAAPSLYPGSPGPQYADPGMFGSFPWIDLGLSYGAVLLIIDTATTGVDVANGLRPLVTNAMNGS